MLSDTQRAALAMEKTEVSCDGRTLFVEVHDNPARAKSDGQNALPVERLEPLLRHLMRLDSVRREAFLHFHGTNQDSD